MVLNSYIIYKENNPIKQMTKLQYTSSIIEALECEWLGKTESDISTHTGQSISGPKVGLRQLPDTKEKNCIVCSGKHCQKRSRSRTVCIKCEKGVHGICLVQHRC
jgi:hypothetical protein